VIRSLPILAVPAAALALGAAVLTLPKLAAAEPVPALVPADTVARAAVARRGLGLSGALRVAVAQTLEPVDPGFASRGSAIEGARYRWLPLHGTRTEPLVGERTLGQRFEAPSGAGIWRLRLTAEEGEPEPDDLTLITKLPFGSKQGRHLNGYHIGIYPTEGSGRSDEYAPPPGFIEVTLENQDFHVSEHFRLRQFVTKDQHDVWPKYVALDLRLIDKLELVLQELNAMGIRAERMHVMSGYRTPQYNGPGGDGRAKLSRHTYGDAADVWVDNEGDGYVSDLNGDGVRDVRDIELMLYAVERVERRYPELVGGAGVYNASGARSPFIHIDVRGTRSRW
jgi:uncharacterized protein YcbK (DUF882 family)